AADRRPRTGAWAPVLQHAQACCEPLTSRGPEMATRRSTRSRPAKCEPTGTSALPGGGMPHASWFEPFFPHHQAKPLLRVRCSSMLEDVEAAGDQTGTVWLPTPLPINRLNVLNHTATPHPQRTSDLVRGPQAPDSSTRSRAADLRPRLMPSRGIRLPAGARGPDRQRQLPSTPPPPDHNPAAQIRVPRITWGRRRPRGPHSKV